MQVAITLSTSTHSIVKGYIKTIMMNVCAGAFILFALVDLCTFVFYPLQKNIFVGKHSIEAKFMENLKGSARYKNMSFYDIMYSGGKKKEISFFCVLKIKE